MRKLRRFHRVGRFELSHAGGSIALLHMGFGYAEGGIEAAAEKYGEGGERLSKWGALRTAAKVTPKASRVAGFIVMWPVAMADEKAESYSITEYQGYWHEGERQTYRLQAEFRELWPELDTPNDLAAQLVDDLKRHKVSKAQIARLPSTLQVVASS